MEGLLTWVCFLASLGGTQGMGVLTVGKPLAWSASLPHLEYVRQHGVLQFIAKYKEVRGICNDKLLWGDEIEYGIVQLDRAQRKARVTLRAAEIREKLNEMEDVVRHNVEGCSWMPEYGSWMVEGTPRGPYSGYSLDLLRVERNMRLRRARLITAVGEDELVATTSIFPQLGCEDFSVPSAPVKGPVAVSDFVPDECINPHPRFAALTQNIRARRGSKVDIRVPLFHDTATPEFQDLGQDLETCGEEERPSINMDCMAFGMGCCCVQVTFQARDVDESRYMFDQLAVLSPVFLALTAATPVMKGRLADTDVRWNTIAASVDDRTPAERGLEDPSPGDERMAGQGKQRLLKSRYDAVSGFIYHCPGAPNLVDKYNDVERALDEWSLQTLKENGVDDSLAKHIAHLFVRDPLVIFEGRIDELDDSVDTDHFENIQSTNWQTVRWKPPPPRNSPNDPHVGWRTEFRPMEVQLTDFENAAYSVFIVLVTRVILAFDLNLYVPLSKVGENMKRAHERDAVLKSLFYFRRNIAPPQTPQTGSVDSQILDPGAAKEKQELSPTVEKLEALGLNYDFSECDSCYAIEGDGVDDSFEEMTMEEIIMGKESIDYPGLIPLVYAYLDHIRCPREVSDQVGRYLELIERRARGQVPTTARWMRDFITSHPDYRQDSVVSDSIAYDLLVACEGIGDGSRSAQDLLGPDVTIRPLDLSLAYDVPLNSVRIQGKRRKEILESYMQRSSHRRSVRSSVIPVDEQEWGKMS